MESKLGLSNHSLRSPWYWQWGHYDQPRLYRRGGEVLGMLCINCGTLRAIDVTPHSSIITGRSGNLIRLKNCIYIETLTLSLAGRERDEWRCNVMNVTIKWGSSQFSQHPGPGPGLSAWQLSKGSVSDLATVRHRQTQHTGRARGATRNLNIRALTSLTYFFLI